MEVMLGGFVLVTAIGSAFYTMGRGFTSLDSARSLSYASQIMQSEFEKMRLTNWDDIISAYKPAKDADSATASDVDIDSSYYAESSIGKLMTMTKLAYWAPGHETDKEVILIKLTITFKTRDGRSLSRSYITYYAKDGLYDYLII